MKITQLSEESKQSLRQLAKAREKRQAIIHQLANLDTTDREAIEKLKQQAQEIISRSVA